MGSADTVPGVSGGTIAFIFGVYEELIFSIKKLTGEVLRLILQGKVRKAIGETPLQFLVPLGLGLVAAIATLAQVVSRLLDTQPVLVWSFFFGLLLASIFIIKKRVTVWNSKNYTVLALSALVAYVMVGLVPVQTPATLTAFFLSGMVAIMAMILPGVSGSFLLILLGKYEQVLGAVTNRDILVLGAVALGAAVGIAVFSRVLSWLFNNYHNVVVASLTGFMIGSLRKVWPWKEEVSPLIERNILPTELNIELAIAVFLIIFAVWFMHYLDGFQAMSEKTSDIKDPELRDSHRKAIKKS